MSSKHTILVSHEYYMYYPNLSLVYEEDVEGLRRLGGQGRAGELECLQAAVMPKLDLQNT